MLFDVLQLPRRQSRGWGWPKSTTVLANTSNVVQLSTALNVERLADVGSRLGQGLGPQGLRNTVADALMET